MKKCIVARKIGMTQIFDENEMVVPVTVVKMEQATVVRIKVKETDQYNSLVVGYGAVNERKLNKPEKGIFKVANLTPLKNLKEFRLDDISGYKIGDEIPIDILSLNERVNARGFTIGRGFTGTIKRWNFHRGPMTHGSKKHRGPGSIGAGTGHSRVLKGKKMSGHYGDECVTIQNLLVVRIDKDQGLIFLKGSIPGKKNNLIEIYK